MTPTWLEHLRRLQAIAQTGLAYTRDPFDLERFEMLRETTTRLMAQLAEAEIAKVEEFFWQDNGYATPKVDIRAAVFQGDALLLVRERSDGLWTGGSPRESIETSEVGFFREERRSWDRRLGNHGKRLTPRPFRGDRCRAHRRRRHSAPDRPGSPYQTPRGPHAGDPDRCSPHDNRQDRSASACQPRPLPATPGSSPKGSHTRCLTATGSFTTSH